MEKTKMKLELIYPIDTHRPKPGSFKLWMPEHARGDRVKYEWVSPITLRRLVKYMGEWLEIKETSFVKVGEKMGVHQGDWKPLVGSTYPKPSSKLDMFLYKSGDDDDWGELTVREEGSNKLYTIRPTSNIFCVTEGWPGGK